MGKRVQRQGVDLEMEVYRICARELHKIPTLEGRTQVLGWLDRAAKQSAPPQATEKADPRQESLPGTNGAAATALSDL